MRRCVAAIALSALALPSSAGLVRSVESGSATAPAAVEPSREITAVPTGGPVAPDGRLDEPCWQAGLWLDDWLLLNGAGRKPEAQTRFKVRFDSQAVYLGVIADEPNMAYLREAYGAAHDAPVYSDDCLEVWVDPGTTEREAFHYVFSVAGGVWDGRQWEETSLDPRAAINAGPKLTRHEDKSWDGAARAAFVKGSDGWTCEVRVPASDFGLPNLVEGSRWGFNIGRERWAFEGGGTGEYGSLTGIFAWPLDAYASLQLGVSPVEVSNLSLSPIGVGENNLRFDCRAPRQDLIGVDVRLTTSDTEERLVRFTVPLGGDKPATVSRTYALAPCAQASATLELLRPGTDAVLFRAAEARDLTNPVRAYPSANLAFLARGPWWVDLDLQVGSASLARSRLLVEVISATGRVRDRERLGDLHPAMRLTLAPRAIGPPGDYTLRFTVLDGRQELGRTELPLRLLRPPT
jgi:hypothetical protein